MERPIFCDMTTATDTPAERLVEYRALFAAHHLRTERTSGGVRHTFRGAATGRLRDLVAREELCCSFLRLEVTALGEEVHWDIGTDAGTLAEAVVEDFAALPAALPAGLPAQKPV
jgi:hypothetical protein